MNAAAGGAQAKGVAAAVDATGVVARSDSVDGVGGVLDRIDSSLLAIPVMYYLLLAYYYSLYGVFRSVVEPYNYEKPLLATVSGMSAISLKLPKPSPIARVGVSGRALHSMLPSDRVRVFWLPSGNSMPRESTGSPSPAD